MFKFSGESDIMKIGERNVAVRKTCNSIELSCFPVIRAETMAALLFSIPHPEICW